MLVATGGPPDKSHAGRPYALHPGPQRARRMRKLAVIFLLCFVAAPVLATDARFQPDNLNVIEMCQPCVGSWQGIPMEDGGANGDMWAADPAWRESWGSRMPMPRCLEHRASRGDSKVYILGYLAFLLGLATSVLYADPSTGRAAMLESTPSDTVPDVVNKFACKGQQILVKTLTGKTITLDLAADETIGRVKAMIERKTGIPAHVQVLVYAGKLLEDGHRLSVHNIKRASLLHMAARLRGGMPIASEGPNARKCETFADILTFTVDVCAKLERLTLAPAPRDGHRRDELERAAERCPHLRSITFEGCLLTDEHVELALRCPNLVEFNFVACLVDDESLQRLAEMSPQLQKINLCSPPITKTVLKSFVTKCPSLQEIKFKDSHTFVHDGDLEDLARCLQECRIQLTSFGLECFRIKTVCSVNYFLQRCPHLQSLDLSSFTRLTDDGLNTLVTNAPALSSVSFTSCRSITDGSMRHLGGWRLLHSVTFEACPQLTDNGLARLIDECSGVKNLNLAKGSQFTDEVAGYLAENCHNLQNVSLEGWLKITDEGLRHFLKLQRLESINIRGCEQISAKACADLLHRFPRLHYVFPVHVPEFVAEDPHPVEAPAATTHESGASPSVEAVAPGRHEFVPVWKVVQTNLPGHQELPLTSDEVFFWTHATEDFNFTYIADADFCDDDLEDLAARKPELKDVVFDHCFLLTDKGLGKLAEMCTKLQNVCLPGCLQITDQGLIELAERCCDLKGVNFEGCPSLTANAFRHLAERCKRLGSVAVDVRYDPRLDPYTKEFTDRDMEHFARNCVHLLAVTFKDFRQLTDTSLQHLAGHCTQLLSVNFKGCVELTSTGLGILAQKCTRLRHVNFRGCKKVTDTGVTNLARSCNELQVVHFAECSRLTDESLEGLGRLRMLETVNFQGCSRLTDQGVRCLEACPRLQQAHFCRCHQLTVEGVAALKSRGVTLSLKGIRNIELLSAPCKSPQGVDAAIAEDLVVGKLRQDELYSSGQNALLTSSVWPLGLRALSSLQERDCALEATEHDLLLENYALALSHDLKDMLNVETRAPLRDSRKLPSLGGIAALQTLAQWLLYLLNPHHREKQARSVYDLASYIIPRVGFAPLVSLIMKICNRTHGIQCIEADVTLLLRAAMEDGVKTLDLLPLDPIMSVEFRVYRVHTTRPRMRKKEHQSHCRAQDSQKQLQQIWDSAEHFARELSPQVVNTMHWWGDLQLRGGDRKGIMLLARELLAVVAAWGISEKYRKYKKEKTAKKEKEEEEEARRRANDTVLHNHEDHVEEKEAIKQEQEDAFFLTSCDIVLHNNREHAKKFEAKFEEQIKKGWPKIIQVEVNLPTHSRATYYLQHEWVVHRERISRRREGSVPITYRG